MILPKVISSSIIKHRGSLMDFAGVVRLLCLHTMFCWIYSNLFLFSLHSQEPALMLVSKNPNFVQNKTILHKTYWEIPISLNLSKLLWGYYTGTHLLFSMILEKKKKIFKILKLWIRKLMKNNIWRKQIFLKNAA